MSVIHKDSMHKDHSQQGWSSDSRKLPGQLDSKTNSSINTSKNTDQKQFPCANLCSHLAESTPSNRFYFASRALSFL